MVEQLNLKILADSPDEIELDFVEFKLTSEGHHVTKCTRPQECKDALASKKYDLVIIGDSTFDRHGISFFDQINEEFAGMPVVVLTERAIDFSNDLIDDYRKKGIEIVDTWVIPKIGEIIASYWTRIKSLIPSDTPPSSLRF